MTLVLLILACGLLGVIIEQALTFIQRRLGRSKPSRRSKPDRRWRSGSGRAPASTGQRPAPRIDGRPAKRSARAGRTSRAGRAAAWPNQVEVVGPPVGPADSWPGLAPVFASAPDIEPVPNVEGVPDLTPEPVDQSASTRRVTGLAPGRPTSGDRPGQPTVAVGEKSELATQTMVPEGSKTVVVPLPVLCGQPLGPAGRSPRRSTPKAVARATEKTSPDQTVWTAVTGRIPRAK